MTKTQVQLFEDYLATRQYTWDETICADRKPVSYLYISTQAEWWISREAVRKIAEGAAYKESVQPA